MTTSLNIIVTVCNDCGVLFFGASDCPCCGCGPGPYPRQIMLTGIARQEPTPEPSLADLVLAMPVPIAAVNHQVVCAYCKVESGGAHGHRVDCPWARVREKALAENKNVRQDNRPPTPGELTTLANLVLKIPAPMVWGHRENPRQFVCACCGAPDACEPGHHKTSCPWAVSQSLAAEQVLARKRGE